MRRLPVGARTAPQHRDGSRTGPWRQDGFSLAEALLGLALLALVLTAFASAAGLSTAFVRHQSRVSEAVAVLEAVTEELLMMSRSEPELTAGVHTRGYDRQGYPVTGSDVYFQVQWSVTSYDETPGIRQIALRCSWREETRPHSLAWTTWRN